MTRGFTLIELLVVVLVIGILSAVALPQYQTAVERSRATEALTQMSAIRDAMERYHAQHEAWPTKFTQLDVDIPDITANLTDAQKALCTAMSNKYYGGKNFCVRFTNGGVITAVRLRNNDSYTLTTTITANSNGTYTATRSCSGDTAYCNAISGGHNSDF